MHTISVFAQNQYTCLHKRRSLCSIEETSSDTLISNCVFLGSGPYNRGHVKLMDATQVVPEKRRRRSPTILASRFSTSMKIGQQNGLLGQIDHTLFFTKQCQFQTPKTSHRTFNGEIQSMMTMTKNMDII